MELPARHASRLIALARRIVVTQIATLSEDIDPQEGGKCGLLTPTGTCKTSTVTINNTMFQIDYWDPLICIFHNLWPERDPIGRYQTYVPSTAKTYWMSDD